ncbi:MAG TPA: serine/threonine-protein kinase, partial [Bacteroidota bacterium]|nr:serine/threonine-protein kinase [Bacteroidota bacterium]
LLTGQEVALKIPDKSIIGDPAQYERFQRELEVMRTLNHPAIQKGLGSGRFNNTPYLVTELVGGESMRELVKRDAPLDPAAAVSLARKIADGLAHCHDHDIIHRDVKPENILISADGQPVILDFGLALTKGSHRVTYANLSSTAGTPDYMAPEQIEGHRGDKRTDLYALGVILFELLTGSPPFSGDNHLAVMAQHLKGGIPRLDKLKPGVSPQIAAVVARCLRRDPDERYADMHALIHDLDNLDGVDTAILEETAAPAAARGFWRSPKLVPAGMAILLLLAIIALAFALQALHK